jgi:hypothetical protein
LSYSATRLLGLQGHRRIEVLRRQGWLALLVVRVPEGVLQVGIIRRGLQAREELVQGGVVVAVHEMVDAAQVMRILQVIAPLGVIAFQVLNHGGEAIPFSGRVAFFGGLVFLGRVGDSGTNSGDAERHQRDGDDRCGSLHVSPPHRPRRGDGDPNRGQHVT